MQIGAIGPTGPRGYTLNPALAALRSLPLTSIRGIAGLFDADFAYTDAARTTLAADGEEVLGMTNLAGAVHASTTATNGHTLVVDSSGKRWIKAGGAGKRCVASAFFGAGVASTGASMYALVKAVDEDGVPSANDGRDALGGSAGRLYRTWNDGSNWQAATTGHADGATAFPGETISQYLVLWSVTTATTRTVGVNGHYVTETGLSGTWTTAGDLIIGNHTGFASAWDTLLKKALVCTVNHSIEEARMVVAQLLASNGTIRNVGIDGDSLVVGGSMSEFATGRGRKLQGSTGARLQILRPDMAVTLYGTSGAVLDDMLADDQSTVGLQELPHMQQTAAVLWGGTNDIDASTAAATSFAKVQTWVAAQKALGLTAIVCTIHDINWSAAKELIRAEFNALIRANAPVDGYFVADLAETAELMDHTSATYYEADGLHLKVAGTSVAARVISDALTMAERSA